MGFVTKDSGEREDFSSGARRDVQTSKPRFDLIPVQALRRLADLYARGAEKYGEGNFEKGIPFKRVYASLLRHLYAWAEGEATEDHLAAVAWNAFALMYYEEQIKAGKLPADLNDMHVDKLSGGGIVGGIPTSLKTDELLWKCKHCMYKCSTHPDKTWERCACCWAFMVLDQE